MFYPRKEGKVQVSHFNPLLYIISINGVNFRSDYNTLFSNIWDMELNGFSCEKRDEADGKRSVYARGWAGVIGG
jgi:hypothetical protein